MELRGKTVVITGGAEGIGFSIAEKLSEESAKVIIVDINDDKGKEAVKKLKTEAIFIKYDLRTNIDVIFNEIINKHERIDILVNNAGVPDVNIQDAIDINFTAAVSLSIKFYEYMKNNNGGIILNISSILGFRVAPSGSVYQATKSAIIAFTRALGHKENFETSGVKVIAVCPGFTRTSMTNKYFDKESTIPKERLAFVKSQIFQDPASVGEATVKILKIAPSGSIWLIEGNKLEEINFHVSTI